MGVYAEFYMVNLGHLSAKVKKIMDVQKSNPEQLEQAVEEVLLTNDHHHHNNKRSSSTKKPKKINPIDLSLYFRGGDDDDTDRKINWKFLIEKLKPRMHVSTLNSHAFDMFFELASDLGLDENWTDDNEFDDLVNYHSIFKSDMVVNFENKFRKEDEDGENELSKEESDRLTKLFTLEPYYPLLLAAIANNKDNEETRFTFIHPDRLQELSEHFNHSRQVPRELLKKSFQDRYDQYLISEPEKKKAKKDQKQEKMMTIEEFIDFEMEIDTFDEILKHYNNPKFVFSLIDRPIVVDSIVQRIWNEEIHNDYWILIMGLIEDPYTLTRLGMTCTNLYQLFQSKKIELFQNFKKDIGLFTTIG